jgi:branched-chain amino acid transport system permease protein
LILNPTRKIALALLVFLLLILPYVAGPYWTGLVTLIYIFGLLALSVDLLLGHAGLFSLTHASFFAVSAYTVAILQVRYGVPTALAAPAGLLAGTLLALVFGLSVRTRGVYFILITIAFGFVVWGVAHRWSSFTGGDNGVTNVPFPAAGPLAITSHTQYYYVVLVAVIACAAGYRVLVRSPFGLGLRGIKSAETRMKSLGYRTTLHLYAAFVLSGALASFAGVLYDGDHRRQRHPGRRVHRLGRGAGAAQLGVELLRAARGGDGPRVHRHGALGPGRFGWALQASL